MPTFIFPDIPTKEDIVIKLDQLILYGGLTCALAPLAYFILPLEMTYMLITGVSVLYISIVWINVFSSMYCSS
jgi:hypothetical protein